ncbi:MAG: tetratricopeptide repeat-containing serine protease family protein [Candidatus Poribacteria bacterium]|nr:tetratricopeptide repeat-containing serine protease family protein [Candidatus Poribacteria bacterium]
MKHQNKLLRQLFTATFTVLLFCSTNGTPAQTVPEIAEKALAATVYLEMQDSNGKTLGFGSGFFVKSNLIATDYHVIAGAASGTAKLVGKHTTYKIEGWTATNEDNDLALLKVSAYGIKPLMLGKSDAVKIGDTVYVAGNPKGLEGTFSDGIISSRRDKYTKKRFQMTAPISPGSSGGPVLNGKGEVIGVSVAAHRDLDAQNLNFAIPSHYLKTLLTLSKPAKPLSQVNQTISAETYFLRGNACYDLGLYDLAIANYDKAIQLEPNDADTYNNRGIAKAKLGQYFAAISDFDKAIQLKPDEATVYIVRGLAKAELGQHFAAISDYDKAIQLKPDEATAYIVRGIAKGNLGQHFAAISDFDKAIQRKPDYAEAYLDRGLAKALLNRIWEAKQDIRTALRLTVQASNEGTKTRAEKALRLLE